MDSINLAFGIVIAGALLLLARWAFRERKTHKAWNQLATQTELEYDHAYDLFGKPLPSGISGTYRGRKVSLAYVTDRPTDDRDHTDRYVRLWIEVKSSDYGMLTYHGRKFLPGMNAFRRGVAYDSEVEFEKQVYIQSDPPGIAPKIFSSPNLRQKLLDGSIPSFTLSRSKVGIESKLARRERNLDYWQGVLDNLCDVAEAVEGSQVSGYFGDA